MEIGMEHIDSAVMARRDCAVMIGILAPPAETVRAFFFNDCGERGSRVMPDVAEKIFCAGIFDPGMFAGLRFA